MNSAHFAADLEKGTTVSDKMAVQLEVEMPKSALLEESLVEQPFATFFASTWAHREPWREDNDLEMPNVGRWLTALISDEPVRRVRKWRTTEEPTARDPAAKANSDRVTLLARKYVSRDRFPEEARARLAIVTERVRQLLPAVTVSDYELLERVLGLVRQIGEADTSIRRELGIGKQKDG